MSLNKKILQIRQCSPNFKVIDLRNLASIEQQQIENMVKAILEANNSHITAIALDELNVCDEGLKELTRLAHVEHLSLSDAEITAEGAGYLSTMQSLKYLDISGNNIGDKGLEAILENKNIEVLSLAACNITDKGASLILNNNQLKKVILMNNELSSELLDKIKKHLEKNNAMSKKDNDLSSANFWGERKVSDAKKETSTSTAAGFAFQSLMDAAFHLWPLLSDEEKEQNLRKYQKLSNNDLSSQRINPTSNA
ncbi:MAG: hypothetical protein ACX932_05155 [Gammaproteobacteria bacterium]